MTDECQGCLGKSVLLLSPSPAIALQLVTHLPWRTLRTPLPRTDVPYHRQSETSPAKKFHARRVVPLQLIHRRDHHVFPNTLNLDLGLLDFDYFSCFANRWLRFSTGYELPCALGLETHFRVLSPREGPCARAEDGLLADFKRGVGDRKDEFEEARRHPWSIIAGLRSAGYPIPQIPVDGMMLE